MSGAGGGSDRAAQLSAAVAVAAAVVVAVLLNVLGARHYQRWDWTRDRRYTLSEPTVQLLQGLQEPIAIHVLTSAVDPLTLTLRHTLTALEAHTQRLEIRFVDPDRDPAAYLALARRYGLAVGEGESDSPAADAAAVVARGSRHHILSYAQLEAAAPAADSTIEPSIEPSIERSLVSAIRRVLAAEAPSVCFTVGHGEDSVDDYGPQGLGTLVERLRNNNLVATQLEPLGQLPGPDPVERCVMVVVAGPKEPFAAADVARLGGYFERGGSLLIALGPVPDLRADRTIDIGLGQLLRAGNITLVDEIVFELDPDRRAGHGLGEAFFAKALPHGVTTGVVEVGQAGADVYLEVAGTLETDEDAPVPSQALLVSSDRSFAMRDFFGWARAPRVPEASERDRRGPLVLARAIERPVAQGSGASRSRMVVVATSSVLHGANWQLPELRTTALLVQGAISWLAAEPFALESKVADDDAARGPRLTEEALSAALRYALLYVPSGIVLLGVSVALRRRSRPGARTARSRQGAADGPPESTS